MLKSQLKTRRRLKCFHKRFKEDEKLQQKTQFLDDINKKEILFSQEIKNRLITISYSVTSLLDSVDGRFLSFRRQFCRVEQRCSLWCSACWKIVLYFEHNSIVTWTYVMSQHDGLWAQRRQRDDVFLSIRSINLLRWATSSFARCR